MERPRKTPALISGFLVHGQDGTWHGSRALEESGQCWKHPRTVRALELPPQHIEAIKPPYVVLGISIPYKVTSKNSQNLVQTNNKCETLSPSASHVARALQSSASFNSFQPLSTPPQPRSLPTPPARETRQDPIPTPN